MVLAGPVLVEEAKRNRTRSEIRFCGSGGYRGFRQAEEANIPCAGARSRTLPVDYLDPDPGEVGIEAGDRSRCGCRVRPEVLLEDDTVLIDDERHDA